MNFLSLSGTCFKQSVLIIITINSNHFSQSDPLYLRGLTELTGSNLLSLSFLSILLPFIYLTSYFFSFLFSFRHILLDGRFLFFVVDDDDVDELFVQLKIDFALFLELIFFLFIDFS